MPMALALHAIAGLVYWRVIVTGGRCSRADIDRLGRFIIAGLRA